MERDRRVDRLRTDGHSRSRSISDVFYTSSLYCLFVGMLVCIVVWRKEEEEDHLRFSLSFTRSFP